MQASNLTHTDFLIIGQGIAGTLLSYELMRLGKSVIVMDQYKPDKSSLVASAVLNPMAGKHWSPSPQAGIFIPKAIATYREMEALLNIAILSKTSLNVFHENEEKRARFEQQINAFPEYFESGVQHESYFNHAFGCGTINGLYQVDAATLLEGWKEYLKSKDAFIDAAFDFHQIEILPNQIKYKNITASKIIFCTGAEAASSPFFQCLPFTKNKGEALLLSIPGLPQNAIYHKQLRLVPKGNDLFWCGSNYVWNFENLKPDEHWKTNAIKELEQWLRLPFEIKDHMVAQRPTTAGQVPIVGMHPQLNTAAIFNGLGTRGFSSGPFWAGELAKQLLDASYQIPHMNQI